MIPSPLLEDIIDGKCLPFIGAGFSKNADLPAGKEMPDWNQLVGIFIKDLGKTASTDKLEIVQEYEKNFNRPKLIETLENALLTNVAKPGVIHRQFVKITDFDIVYTTNFDSLLEDACRIENLSCKSIVGPHQVTMLAKSPTVNIIKMHGDILHPEYLVLTKDDYENYMKNYASIALNLSNQLMTKTPLFLGYSITDPNLQQIKETIENVLGKFVRKGYIVLFNPTPKEIEEYEKMNLHVIPLVSTTKSKSELLLDFLNEISLYKSLKSITNGIEVIPKRTVVVCGGTIVIQTKINPITKGFITLNIVNEEGIIVHESKIPGDKNIQITRIITKGEKWKAGRKYKIIAEYDGKSSEYTIQLSEPLLIVAQTDRTIYFYRSMMIATVINPNVIHGEPAINLEIFGPGEKLVYKNAVPVSEDSNGIYQETILIGGKDWSSVPGSKFKMVAEYAGQRAEVSFLTSNFGAAVELDQRVYTWTDRVYITVIAPDYNRDPNVPDVIGDEELGKITIATRNHILSPYALMETGPDTGIFTGYITLSGNPSIKGTSGVDGDGLNPTGFGPSGIGPTDGILPADNVDGISVIFDHSPGNRVVGSSLIRWSVGQIKWLEPNYSINEEGIIQIIDPDMNLDPNEVDKFDVRIWSDSDPNGIKIAVVETGEATGIFQGSVSFIKDAESQGNKLKVSNGDKVTAEYIDRTLPVPYSNNDTMRLTSTTVIGNLIPPSEKISISNQIIIDKNNEKIEEINEREFIQIGANLTNNQDKSQPFAFILQIQNEMGIAVHNSFTSGTLIARQSSKIFLPWIAQESGSYGAQLFVFKSIEEPEALTRPINLRINVKKRSLTESASGESSKYSLTSGVDHIIKISSGSGNINNPQFFVPEFLNIKQGDTIVWINEDSMGHTITNGLPSDDNAGSIFDSGILRAGQKFKFTFKDPGTYNYFCVVHPWMIGKIVVN